MSEKIPSKLLSSLHAMRTAIDNLIEAQPKFELGKKPNKRAGFYHIHSASYECGQAYVWTDENDQPRTWRPCSKLVNHPGQCGYEDNTAF